MTLVFISHARSDQSFARKLAARLAEHAIVAWRNFGFLAAERRAAALRACIERCDMTIALWSKKALADPALLDLATSALAKQKLISVLVEDDVALPPILRALEVTDFSQWSGDRRDPRVQQLVDSLLARSTLAEVSELEAELAAFKTAEKAATASAYLEFLEHYPNGAFADIVREASDNPDAHGVFAWRRLSTQTRVVRSPAPRQGGVTSLASTTTASHVFARRPAASIAFGAAGVVSLVLGLSLALVRNDPPPSIGNVSVAEAVVSAIDAPLRSARPGPAVGERTRPSQSVDLGAQTGEAAPRPFDADAARRERDRLDAIERARAQALVRDQAQAQAQARSLADAETERLAELAAVRQVQARAQAAQEDAERRRQGELAARQAEARVAAAEVERQRLAQASIQRREAERLHEQELQARYQNEQAARIRLFPTRVSGQGYATGAIAPDIQAAVRRARSAETAAREVAARARRAGAAGATNAIYTPGRGYEGEWSNGLPNGAGAGAWSDGSAYLGTWRNGARHGFGAYRFADGRIFEGEFVNGQPTRLGVLWDANGQVVSGAAMFAAFLRMRAE